MIKSERGGKFASTSDKESALEATTALSPTKHHPKYAFAR